MPHVVNGIGTWYYGKRRIHRYKKTCGFCHRVGELESYDTTLYFVVFFVPLIPLSNKRVLEYCPSCTRHRVMSLKKWEQGKAEDTAQVLERLKANPDDRDTILAALDLALGYQDADLFEKLAQSLAGHRKDDAAIQVKLGAGYGYFARYPEAEQAYRAALAVEDNPDVRELLALVLLKQGRPEEAAPYLEPIVAQKMAGRAGMIFLLIEGFQQEGLHEKALAYMDRRDAAFPDLAEDKSYKKQRALSQRYRTSDKKIKSAYLSESGRTGYSEGSWTAYVPRIVAALILLGLVAWYLGAAFYIGQARKIFVLNGTSKPYDVALNGRALSLRPGAPATLRVPEGDLQVEFQDPRLGQEPSTYHLETSFFSRPFTSPTYVLNPDRLAIVESEETVYAEVPTPPRQQPQLHVGEGLYEFTGIDYEFTDFPLTLKLDKGHTLTKTRVAVVPLASSEQRLRLVSNMRDEKQTTDYARRWLNFEPTDLVALNWFLEQAKDEDGIAFLRARLNDRPPLIDWHRMYQSKMERVHPDHDLCPEYRKLVTETREAPDALYLLGRVEDLDRADELFRKGAAANPPSAYALYAVGYGSLAQGQFADAVRWMENAMARSPDNLHIKRFFEQALFAAGQYDRLLERLNPRSVSIGDNISVLAHRVRVYAAKGDRNGARDAIKQLDQWLSGPDGKAVLPVMRAQMEVLVSLAERDEAGYLKQLAQIPNAPVFYPTLLRGKLEDAATKIPDADTDEAVIDHGLVYLAARKANKPKLADEELQKLRRALGKGDREERQLAGILARPETLDITHLRRTPVEPQLKRVLLAVAARLAPPDKGKELIALARKLDFHKDATSLCLRKILGE